MGYTDYWTIKLVIHLALCTAIGYWGHHKRITGTYAFLLSATLTPFVGAILTLISPALGSKRANAPNTVLNKTVAIVSFIFGGLIVASVAYGYFTEKEPQWGEYQAAQNREAERWVSFIFGIGLIILGEYLHKPPESDGIDN